MQKIPKVVDGPIDAFWWIVLPAPICVSIATDAEGCKSAGNIVNGKVLLRSSNTFSRIQFAPIPIAMKSLVKSRSCGKSGWILKPRSVWMGESGEMKALISYPIARAISATLFACPPAPIINIGLCTDHRIPQTALVRRANGALGLSFSLRPKFEAL